MENVATSVRIAGDSIGVLSKLSSKLGQSKAQVIEIALKQLEERIFWDEVTESFARKIRSSSCFSAISITCALEIGRAHV